MPIYEYECQECGRIFEKIQRFSDDPLTEYVCGCEGRTTAVPVKKKVSAAAFHLKGGGWYVTDFRDGGKKKAPLSHPATIDGCGADGICTLKSREAMKKKMDLEKQKKQREEKDVSPSAKEWSPEAAGKTVT